MMMGNFASSVYEHDYGLEVVFQAGAKATYEPRLRPRLRTSTITS